jgi:hypothetical protein
MRFFDHKKTLKKLAELKKSSLDFSKCPICKKELLVDEIDFNGPSIGSTAICGHCKMYARRRNELERSESFGPFASRYAVTVPDWGYTGPLSDQTRIKRMLRFWRLVWYSGIWRVWPRVEKVFIYLERKFYPHSDGYEGWK